MSKLDKWAVGIDLGGTKVEVACVDDNGRTRPANDVRRLAAGDWRGRRRQIALDNGEVLFAPDLGWKQVPLQAELHCATAVPALVTNDVRAATWGEYRFGAGQNVVRRHKVSTSRIGLVPLEPNSTRLVAYHVGRTPWDS